MMETLTFLLTSSFYPPYSMGGDANHVMYLAEELTRRGHEVHVLHSIDASKVKRIAPKSGIESQGVHTHTIETPLRTSAFAAYLLGNSHAVTKRLLGLVRESSPDVVHHHNISLLGYRILRKCGRYLSLYTAHDYWLFCQQNNLMKFGRIPCITKQCVICSFAIGKPRQLWRSRPDFVRAIHEIDWIVAPSNFMLETLKSEFADLRICCIPNFAPPASDSLASGCRDRSNQPYLVYVGVLERHKGLIPFLARYATWTSQNDIQLRLIGTGSLRHWVAEFIRNNEMQQKICMLGRVSSSETRWHISGALGLVLPAVCPENAPLAAIESLSLGTPVLSSNLGGLPEIVARVDPRLLFSWDETRSVESALDYLLERGEQLRPSARDASRYFSRERYMERYFDLIGATRLRQR